jgi:hypothetical protein
VSSAESTGDDAAVLMHIASLPLQGVLIGAVSAIAVAVFAVVVVCGAISFAEGSVLVVRVSVFIMAFTAAMFAFKLNAFSRRFFFWECFPCPGPGIAEYRKLRENEIDWFWIPRLVLWFYIAGSVD